MTPPTLTSTTATERREQGTRSRSPAGLQLPAPLPPQPAATQHSWSRTSLLTRAPRFPTPIPPGHTACEALATGKDSKLSSFHTGTCQTKNSLPPVGGLPSAMCSQFTHKAPLTSVSQQLCLSAGGLVFREIMLRIPAPTHRLWGCQVRHTHSEAEVMSL